MTGCGRFEGTLLRPMMDSMTARLGCHGSAPSCLNTPKWEADAEGSGFGGRAQFEGEKYNL